MSRMSHSEIENALSKSDQYIKVWSLIELEGTWEFYNQLALLAVKHIRNYRFSMYNHHDKEQDTKGSGGTDSDYFEFRLNDNPEPAVRVVRSHDHPSDDPVSLPLPALSVELYDYQAMHLFEEVAELALLLVSDFYSRMEICTKDT